MGPQISLHTSLNTLRHACATMHAIDNQTPEHWNGTERTIQIKLTSLRYKSKATLNVVYFIQRDHSQFLWQLIGW